MRSFGSLLANCQGSVISQRSLLAQYLRLLQLFPTTRRALFSVNPLSHSLRFFPPSLSQTGSMTSIPHHRAFAQCFIWLPFPFENQFSILSRCHSKSGALSARPICFPTGFPGLPFFLSTRCRLVRPPPPPPSCLRVDPISSHLATLCNGIAPYALFPLQYIFFCPSLRCFYFFTLPTMLGDPKMGLFVRHRQRPHYLFPFAADLQVIWLPLYGADLARKNLLRPKRCLIPSFFSFFFPFRAPRVLVKHKGRTPPPSALHLIFDAMLCFSFFFACFLPATTIFFFVCVRKLVVLTRSEANLSLLSPVRFHKGDPSLTPHCPATNLFLFFPFFLFDSPDFDVRPRPPLSPLSSFFFPLSPLNRPPALLLLFANSGFGRLSLSFSPAFSRCYPFRDPPPAFGFSFTFSKPETTIYFFVLSLLWET